jgi:hypothetical protein
MPLDLSQALEATVVEGGLGDRAFLTQLVPRGAAGSYYSIDKFAALPSFDLGPGQVAAVSTTLVNVPQSKQANVAWRRSLFEAMASEVGPNATRVSESFTVFAEPAGNDRVSFGFLPQLFSIVDPGTNDVSATILYGNPFPSSWGEIASAWIVFSVQPAPNARRASAIVGFSAPLSALSAMEVRPLVGPPRDFHVDGQPTGGMVSGVGTTPLLSWSAPTVGTASFYEVRIRSNESSAEDAIFWTREPTLQIPQGMLASGHSYSIVVQSVYSSRPVTSPLRYQPLEATATGVLGDIAP